WKVGKTRLVNALVAAPDLLPVDDEHDTPYVAEVVEGPVSFEIWQGNRCRSLSRDEFLDLCRHPEPDPAIHRLVVRTPLPALGGSLVLIDTPALEAASPVRTEVTLGCLLRADVILLVLDAITGVREAEYRFVREYLTDDGWRQVIVVLNKIDHLSSRGAVDS